MTYVHNFNQDITIPQQNYIYQLSHSTTANLLANMIDIHFVIKTILKIITDLWTKAKYDVVWVNVITMYNF